MAGGLVGLLDDIAALAKLAAASIDDVGAAAGKASAKAAGVVVDDAAVTPTYVRGLAAERELPIIKRIAVGSLRNKLLIILPAALVLSSVAPILVEIILMLGGSYLSYEGAHKIMAAWRHTGHGTATDGVLSEAETIAGAIRTDFILSIEIMVIALKEVIDEPVLSRGIILAVVGLVITLGVYGVVGLIVKMDDVGLRLVEKPSTERLGRALVAGMPKVLATLSAVGVAAMLWVGGHILLVGSDELGWSAPYHHVHGLEELVAGTPVAGAALGWLVVTAASALVGLLVGFVVVAVVGGIQSVRSTRRSGASSH